MHVLWIGVNVLFKLSIASLFMPSKSFHGLNWEFYDKLIEMRTSSPGIKFENWTQIKSYSYRQGNGVSWILIDVNSRL